MRVSPEGRKSITRQAADGLEIIIPAKRNIFLMLFLSAWLVGWGFGEVFTARELLTQHTRGPDIFLFVWLIMWTVGGGMAGYAWLWMAKARETVTLRTDALAIKRDVLGFGGLREYDLAHITNLRVAPATWNPFDWTTSMQFWGIGGGVLAFDYGAKTVRFAGSVDEAEAQQIVHELRATRRLRDRPA